MSVPELTVERCSECEVWFPMFTKQALLAGPDGLLCRGCDKAGLLDRGIALEAKVGVFRVRIRELQTQLILAQSRLTDLRNRPRSDE